MFVTNTLGNPDDDEGWIPGILAPIAKSRKEANKIKREEPITVVIGNPPYKVASKGLGGWIEGQGKKAAKTAPLSQWQPPAEWGAGADAKHLRNLYIYFWRWATWKVCDHGPGNKTGIVCFISAAGFLSGPGFQKMRDYLRRTCDDIWVIDCSPEGFQASVNTRIFQGVQQPVCIVIASRSEKSDASTPARVRFKVLPAGHREIKFKALGELGLASKSWTDCPSEWRAPFLPASTGPWAGFPRLEDLFAYNGSGVMPGRTWVIAPDPESLEARWQRLIHAAPPAEMERLFHPHLAKGKLGDRHTHRVLKEGLHGFEFRKIAVADDKGACVEPIQYGFRSFDRQWIIPDNRLINRPNPELWNSRSDRQTFLTAFTEESPTQGPAVTFTALIPDLHHYKGSFGGRVFPLWRDEEAKEHNIRPALLPFLSKRYGQISAEDFVAYVAAIAANPAYTKRFQADLSTPGLRIPLTADQKLFKQAQRLGRKVIWLHTFGERMADPEDERPIGPPRLPSGRRPLVPTDGAISSKPSDMPDSIDYDAAKQRLLLGHGHVENVSSSTWNYHVCDKQVLHHWFSYRKRNRERPIIGDRRPPSPLGEIQPDHWLPEYTTELLNVLNVLGLLVELEPVQAELLDKICSGSLISTDELSAAGALGLPPKPKKKVAKKKIPGPSLFESHKN